MYHRATSAFSRVQGVVVRLIERSVIRAEVPPGKSPPPVPRWPGTAPRGRRSPSPRHSCTEGPAPPCRPSCGRPVGLEVAVVLEGGIQGELVQSRGNSRRPHSGRIPASGCTGTGRTPPSAGGSCPLGPQAHLVKFLPVDDRGTGDIFLRRGVFQKGRPVLHPQVHRVNPVVVKEAGGIPGRGAGWPRPRTSPKQAGR